MKEPITTELISAHSAAQFDEAVARASALLARGELVALPTETVYGLAANALQTAAVEKIFQVKGRPAHNPIIVHVADLTMARQCARHWPAEAEALAQAFWPGPLTLVLPRSTLIPDIVTAGGDTVGIRWPSHPLMQAVIQRCGFPLAAPSANISNHISPTTARHVLAALGGKIPLVVDGGASQVGIESVVLDLTVRPAQVLRWGMIHEAALQAVLGPRGVVAANTHEKPNEPAKSPGLLRRHYSPKARLLLLTWEQDADLVSQLVHRNLEASRTWVVSFRHVPTLGLFQGVSVVPHDAEAFAQAIYAELHGCDADHPAAIVVEAPPESVEWKGIKDRLIRAACSD